MENLNFSGTVCFQNENIGLNALYALGGKIHSCSFCSYITRKASHMKSHLLTHTGEYPFTCTVCNYKCKQKQNLSRHFLLKHRP